MKHLKFTSHELYACVLLIGALALRILLARGYWPLPNSDEATMGLMAMHIQHGEWPIFFYGQHYMGVLEAYAAAPFFSMFGVSVFTLRLSLTLLFMLFLVTMYLLVRTLYTRNFALFALLLLSLGSNAVLSRELSAIGGYVETLLFATLSFLLAAWLALTSDSRGRHAWLWRFAGYGAWGLVIGLGVWCDELILPFALCSGLILLLFCWRELARGAVLPLLLFFLLGAAPLIVYNLHAAPGQDSWSVLMALQGHEPLSKLGDQAGNTLELSLPTITGSPFCHYSEFANLDILGYETSHALTPQCATINVSWSLAYLGLFGLVVGILGVALWKKRFPWRARVWLIDERTATIKLLVQLLLCLSGAITIILFLHGYASFGDPATHSRYMIGLWISAPVVIWPLWKSASAFARTFLSGGVSWLWLRGAMSAALLLALFAIFLGGSARTVSELPTAAQARQYEQGLIDGLHKADITHVYSSEYWTCNRLIFETREQVICAVINAHLRKGYTRGDQYFTIVSHDPWSSYLFPSSMMRAPVVMAAERRLQREKRAYHDFIIEDYIVIQPLSTFRQQGGSSWGRPRPRQERFPAPPFTNTSLVPTLSQQSM